MEATACGKKVHRQKETGCERNRLRLVLDPAVLTFKDRQRLLFRKYRDCGCSFHRLSLSAAKFYSQAVTSIHCQLRIIIDEVLLRPFGTGYPVIGGAGIPGEGGTIGGDGNGTLVVGTEKLHTCRAKFVQSLCMGMSV